MRDERAFTYCRLCKSEKIRFLFKKEGLIFCKCLKCGIVFLANKISDESVKELYSYYAYNPLSNYLSPVTKLRYEMILDNLEKYRKNNTLIDVGCGAGYFMKAAAEKGWQVDGSEISDEAIRLAEQKGLLVIRGDITSIDLTENKYDVAILFELMEHAVDTEGIIKKLFYALRPGGLVYITTPNYNSLARRLIRQRWGLFNKEHIFYFTPQILRALLKKYNFKIVKMKTENLLLGEILKIFRKADSIDNARIYQKQEDLRSLIEEKKSLSALKNVVNFWLNLFKTGETIYLFAEK